VISSWKLPATISLLSAMLAGFSFWAMQDCYRFGAEIGIFDPAEYRCFKDVNRRIYKFIVQVSGLLTIAFAVLAFWKANQE